MLERAARHDRWLVALSFACIWLIWGSTFLAIRYAIVDIPPLLMCGLRLVLAAGLLLGYAIATGARWPRGVEWRNAALVGVLLPGIGNASVTTRLIEGDFPNYQQLIPSGYPNRLTVAREALMDALDRVQIVGNTIEHRVPAARHQPRGLHDPVRG